MGQDQNPRTLVSNQLPVERVEARAVLLEWVQQFRLVFQYFSVLHPQHQPVLNAQEVWVGDFRENLKALIRIGKLLGEEGYDHLLRVVEGVFQFLGEVGQRFLLLKIVNDLVCLYQVLVVGRAEEGKELEDTVLFVLFRNLNVPVSF